MGCGKEYLKTIPFATYTHSTEHPRKAPFGIEGELSNVISDKYLQSEKQFVPTLSTLLGIRIALIPDSRKARSPISFNLESDPKTTIQRQAHLRKQYSPIFSTLLGIRTAVTLEPLKAHFPISLNFESDSKRISSRDLHPKKQ
jgi:hypothetical protein